MATCPSKKGHVLFDAALINLLAKRELTTHRFGLADNLRLGFFIQQSLENLARKNEGR